MTRGDSIQTVHLDLEAIEDDVVHLVGGQYRAVLEVGSVNFALQGEVEREATLAGFAAFLNGLSFPVQLVLRALPIDLERYLADLERRALHLPGRLADLARDHVAFLRRLARSRTLLERRFYLVVPAGSDDATRAALPWKRTAEGRDLEEVRKQLTFRCEEVRRQLGRCGLAVRRLDSVELARLLYACWCPELARVQRVHRDLAEYASLVVTVGTGRGPLSPTTQLSNRRP